MKSISGDAVTLSSTASIGREWNTQGINTVVLACGGFPNDGLYIALKPKVKELHMVGDCEAPLPIERAMYSAELLGRALLGCTGGAEALGRVDTKIGSELHS